MRTEKSAFWLVRYMTCFRAAGQVVMLEAAGETDTDFRGWFGGGRENAESVLRTVERSGSCEDDIVAYFN